MAAIERGVMRKRVWKGVGIMAGSISVRSPAQRNRCPRRFVLRSMPLRQRLLPLYGIAIALIAASFLWQMIHGICPVP